MQNASTPKTNQPSPQSGAHKTAGANAVSMPAVPVLQNAKTVQQKKQPAQQDEPLQHEFSTDQNTPTSANGTSMPAVPAFKKNAAVQSKARPVQFKANNTGLPDNLKSGVEQLSGFAMDDVKVHYNSAQPAQLNALAYAQGTDIHIGPGQEKHLPHEAWHVAQQKQGRVQPTLQMKNGSAVNDDAGLEKEADQMGAQALQPVIQQANAKVLQQKSLQAVTNNAKAVQRVVRIGPPDTIFINTADDIPETVRLSEEETAVLEQLVADSRLYGFLSWAEVKLIAGSPVLLKLLRSPSFTTTATYEAIHEKFKYWMLGQLVELLKTVKGEEVEDDANKLMDELEADDPAVIFRKVVEADTFLTRAHLGMFKLNTNRQTDVDDGDGDVEDRMYGYHLTKIHNLKGIAAKGLDPGAGAGTGGSLAMSTDAQKVGSTATSKGVVAFGLAPSTFRPYINQYADRRQMIEGTPDELKPIMLRFRITDTVRKSSQSLLSQGKVDFMDKKARNTEVGVSPDDIEVLSANGWVRIAEFDANEQPIHEMRSGNDNARADVEWKGDTAIFTYEEVQTAGIQLFSDEKADEEEDDDEAEAAPVIPDEQQLEALRDTVVLNKDNIRYTFRGATMQTSGNRSTWHYAIGVESTAKPAATKGGAKAPPPAPVFPKWLETKIVAYKKNFAGLAESQIAAYKKGSDGTERPASAKPKPIPAQTFNDKLTIGTASGTGLNCLLDTIDQLSHNRRTTDARSVEELRRTLVAINLAPDVGMIDIYGGAGMQLANDLNLRIQVIEQGEGGGYIVHPIIGQSGRLVYILHTPDHFQPLWPK